MEQNQQILCTDGHLPKAIWHRVFPVDPILIANHCGKEWARYAFDDNFSTSFRSAKYSGTLIVDGTSDKDKACVMEKPITMLELCNCLHKLVTIEITVFYIPPTQDISALELSNLISSFSSHLLVVGDFNGRNTIWGSTSNNNRGMQVEMIIADTGLCMLNDGSP
ncbi:Probable RNA-directed DNA polymerase from transposon BS [Eumeta japonica]|uniref:Probable RNA-directed DNA polymerase from transposon BS n=1 Tax=Eumeta variegata TaxID=151549 RepID=A0A4C1T422_EUMVA|nr:Probable RNA-directed DNA polymerase from transposon BS [Eumeta japonica]